MIERTRAISLGARQARRGFQEGVAVCRVRTLRTLTAPALMVRWTVAEGKSRAGVGKFAAGHMRIWMLKGVHAVLRSFADGLAGSCLLSRLYRILRKGTMRGYASVAFSPHNKAGLWLASAGTSGLRRYFKCFFIPPMPHLRRSHEVRFEVGGWREGSLCPYLTEDSGR